MSAGDVLFFLNAIREFDNKLEPDRRPFPTERIKEAREEYDVDALAYDAAKVSSLQRQT